MSGLQNRLIYHPILNFFYEDTYATQLKNLAHSRQRIIYEYRQITPEMLPNECLRFKQKVFLYES